MAVAVSGVWLTSSLTSFQGHGRERQRAEFAELLSGFSQSTSEILASVPLECDSNSIIIPKWKNSFFGYLDGAVLIAMLIVRRRSVRSGAESRYNELSGYAGLGLRYL
jgi:hypothetical protein